MLLEEIIGKKLRHHACRHRIYVLIAKALYKEVFEVKNTGPENIYSKKFRAIWKDIDKSQDITTLIFESNSWLQQNTGKGCEDH